MVLLLPERQCKQSERPRLCKEERERKTKREGEREASGEASGQQEVKLLGQRCVCHKIQNWNSNPEGLLYEAQIP